MDTTMWARGQIIATTSGLASTVTLAIAKRLESKQGAATRVRQPPTRDVSGSGLGASRRHDPVDSNGLTNAMLFCCAVRQDDRC